MSSNNEILIAGGGLGGLSAALALSNYGRKVRVLEKAAEFGEIGYGIQMGPNIVRMLRKIGIARALEETYFLPDALIILDAMDGSELSRINLDEKFQQRYGDRYFVIHRRDLHGAMLDECKRRPEIALEASKGLKRFEQRGDGIVAHCEDGSEYFGAALVGADGLWSAARAQIIGDQPRLAGHVVYRGVVPTEEITDTRYINSVILYVGPGMHLVQYRLRGGKVMNNVVTFVSPGHARGEKNFGGVDELNQVIAPLAPEVKDRLKYFSTERNWILHDRDSVTNWTQGRATLLGDAAHPTLQYLAQGACMAIEDAVVLASKLGRDATDINAAFLAYQAERLNRTARVVNSARFFGHFMHCGGGARLLRNELLRQRDLNNPWELDWLYKGIPVPD